MLNLTTEDLINIFLPILSHWVIWIFFLVGVSIILSLYAYPYIKKPRKEFHSQHIAIPITSVISLYIFTKMLEGVIYSGSILKVDLWVNNINFNNYFSWINTFALIITTFGSGAMIASLFIVALAILILKKRWRFALLSTVAIVGALILQSSIKSIVQRIRPENLIETTFSFPSGHSNMAIVFVSLLIYSFKDDLKHASLKYLLIIVSSSFFITVGITRILLHVHWFSDVIAGFSLGLAWFMFLILVERLVPGLVKAVKIETKEAKHIVSPIVSKKRK